jgi:phosphate transport system substrate-binding protein
LSGVRVVVRDAGSDTMVNLAQAWAEEYATVMPSVSVEVGGGGSATGIASLIDGTADLANCSRKMEPEEIAAARARWGREPVEWTVGFDALAIYVHPSNPLQSVTLDQLAHVYGREHEIQRWKQLGVTIPGVASDGIILISRQSNSGTYQYFRQTILGARGDFRLGTRDLNGSKEVVTLIASVPTAIGYSGMGYATPEVKMLHVAKKAGEEAYPPTAENTINGHYPISRPLYIYTLGQPSKPVLEYLRWIQTAAGQKVVEQSGYVPVGKSEGDPQ